MTDYKAFGSALLDADLGLSEEQAAEVVKLLQQFDQDADVPAMDQLRRTLKKPQTAMDAQTRKLVNHMNDIKDAEAVVRPFVGELVGMDSADDVYCTALEMTARTPDHVQAARELRKYPGAGKAGWSAFRGGNGTSPRLPRVAQDSVVSSVLPSNQEERRKMLAGGAAKSEIDKRREAMFPHFNRLR